MLGYSIEFVSFKPSNRGRKSAVKKLHLKSFKHLSAIVGQPSVEHSSRRYGRGRPPAGAVAKHRTRYTHGGCPPPRLSPGTPIITFRVSSHCFSLLTLCLSSTWTVACGDGGMGSVCCPRLSSVPGYRDIHRSPPLATLPLQVQGSTWLRKCSDVCGSNCVNPVGVVTGLRPGVHCSVGRRVLSRVGLCHPSVAGLGRSNFLREYALLTHHCHTDPFVGLLSR